MHSSCSLTSNESPWILIARRRGTTATTEPKKMTQISQSMSVPLTSHVMWNPNSSAYLLWIFNGPISILYQQIDGKITTFPSFSQDFLSTSPCPCPEAENHRPQGAAHGGPGTDVHVKVPQGPVLSRKFPSQAWLIGKNPWRYRILGWTRIYGIKRAIAFFWKKNTLQDNWKIRTTLLQISLQPILGEVSDWFKMLQCASNFKLKTSMFEGQQRSAEVVSFDQSSDEFNVQ